VNNDLKAYQAHYKSVHGEEIPMGLMIEEMLKGYLAEDKNFQKSKVPAAK
jgi:hypothetical protein